MLYAQRAEGPNIVWGFLSLWQRMNGISKIEEGKRDAQHRQENKTQQNSKMHEGDGYPPWCFFLSPSHMFQNTES